MEESIHAWRKEVAKQTLPTLSLHIAVQNHQHVTSSASTNPSSSPSLGGIYSMQPHLASEQIFGMNTELLKIKKHKEKVCATEKEAIQSAKTAVRNAPNSLYEGIRDKIDKAMRDIKAAKEKKEAEISMLVERERLLRKALGDKADMWE